MAKEISSSNTPESLQPQPDISALVAAEVAKALTQAEVSRERKLAEEANASAAALAKKKEKAAFGPDPHALVKIKLMMDKQNVEPYYVRLNDYTREIPRNVEVEVPYFVAKHLEEIQNQDAGRIMMVNGLVEAYNKKAAELGV